MMKNPGEKVDVCETNKLPLHNFIPDITSLSPRVELVVGRGDLVLQLAIKGKSPLIFVRVCGVGYESKPLDYGYMSPCPCCELGSEPSRSVLGGLVNLILPQPD